MSINPDQIRKGSKVVIKEETGEYKTIIVECVDKHEEDSQHIIDYTDPDEGDARWAYLTQVTKVESY